MASVVDLPAPAFPATAIISPLGTQSTPIILNRNFGRVMASSKSLNHPFCKNALKRFSLVSACSPAFFASFASPSSLVRITSRGLGFSCKSLAVSFKMPTFAVSMVGVASVTLSFSILSQITLEHI